MSAVRLSIGPLLDDAAVDLACERIARCGAALALPASTAAALETVKADAALEAGMELDAIAARGWLAANPDAIVVDVRDAREHSVAHVDHD
ncbi:hypothetical protein, partial [Acinetobacter baumannii]|uniref:hypothetical protein n=1 Tax=Acinetobacter baumannii TaxID=470 RepID=UPI00289E1CAA